MQKSSYVFAGAAAAALVGVLGLSAALSPTQDDERLTFQTHQPWSARINLEANVAMTYGIDPSLPARMETWRQHGYRVEVMTGVAWGEYQDYLDGKFDGKNHWDEAQKQSDGKLIQHGKTVPYIAPGLNYGRYLSTDVKQALDAGAKAIYLEEPEFWARAGWSDSFKREWRSYYGEDWQAPDSSPDAQYRASKLKYFLYRRALQQVFTFVGKYGKEHGRSIPCYVPTHSLINYASWRIVSPESSLIDVGADGYIAQVWTGTAREPNVYEGRRKERTFETAYLEYGAMQNLVRASGRRVWYLNDPIEDNPNHTWTDYRTNWESTLTASLLQPEVSRYEIMPWPERIFNGKRPVEGKPGERSGIPAAYATELQTVIHALGEMKQPADQVHWQQSGIEGMGVLVSDTMMFQRAAPDSSDANLGSFYGLALPLLKRGIPVEPVQIESATKPGFLSRYCILLLTYEGQKPPTERFHEALAEWVRKGGVLVVVDNDGDQYDEVREWWNKAPMHYRTPREELFERLGVAQDATGLRRVGKGFLIRDAASPAAMTYRADGADKIRALVKQGAKAIGLPWRESNALVLRRGPFAIAGGLDESIPNAEPYVVRGSFLNLFDPQLAVVRDVRLEPGTRALLFDLRAVNGARPRVIAAACRVRDERYANGELRFTAEGIGDTGAVVRIAASHDAKQVSVSGKAMDASQYDFSGGSLRLRFPNEATPVQVAVQF